MKKALLIVTIGLLCFNIAKAKKIEGYFITKSLDTVKVTFKIPLKFFSKEPNYENLHWKIKYYDSLEKKHTLKPAVTKEIFFNYKGETIRMLSVPNNLFVSPLLMIDDSYIYLHLIQEGKLKLFKYYKTQSAPVTGYGGGVPITYSPYIDKYVMQKDNGVLFQPRWIFFQKDMEAYLSDCPELAKNIEEKIYNRKDIEQIVDGYNKSCK